MNYLQQTQDWFLALPIKHKINLTLLLGAIILIFGVLGFWVLTPSYAVLFTDLEEQDANRILTQLEQDHIPYQIQTKSGEILIPNTLIAKTRLKIMNNNTQLTGSVGFELFDKSDFGMTDFSQKINYLRALQGELERTISSLEEVSQARVHLTIPENHLFEKETNKPKAAVSLHLKRVLTPKQIRSIQHLLTASVAHLSIENVVIVDQNGNTLSRSKEDGSFSHLTTKKSIEHYLSEKVNHMLHQIFTDSQVMVKIDVSINYDELQSELIKPQNQGQITHEKETRNAQPHKSDKNKTNQISSFEKTYQFGSEKQVFKRAAGTIERLSISVVVPQNTTKEMRSQIERLVKSSVGFNPQRGDTISVEALITARIESQLPKIPTMHTLIPTKKINNSMGYLIPALVVLLSAITILIMRTRAECIYNSSSHHRRAAGRRVMNCKPTLEPELTAEPPDWSRQLAEQEPLYLAIILEQGLFDWQESFLKKYPQGPLIRLLLGQTVNCLKPATKTLVLKLWQHQFAFSTHLEDEHG